MAEDRARSFMERYVIARASHFSVENELEDMHKATLMAKTAYRNIANVSRSAEPAAFEHGPTQGPMPAGATGPVGPNSLTARQPPTMTTAIMTANGPVNAQDAKEEDWLSAGRGAMREAIKWFLHAGKMPPTNLVIAARDAAAKEKKWQNGN